MAARNLKREHLHQPMADSYHSSASRKRSVGSTHSARRVLRARRRWRSKIDCGYGIESRKGGVKLGWSCPRLYINWRYTKLDWRLRYIKLLSLNWQEVDVEINEQIKVDLVLTPPSISLQLSSLPSYRIMSIN